MPAPADRLPLRICRGAIAFVWSYHGLVPKLLGPAADELLMDRALGVSDDHAVQIARTAGVAEIAMAACVLLLPRREWPLWLTLGLMAALLAYVALFVPALLAAAFNPVTINLCVMALAAVALCLQRGR